jgi:hypothetical protein
MSGVDRVIAFGFVLALMPFIAVGMLAVNLCMACLDTVRDIVFILGAAASDDW